jgi:hypothetical protein
MAGYRFSIRAFLVLFIVLAVALLLVLRWYPYMKAYAAVQSCGQNEQWLAQLKQLGDAGTWALYRQLQSGDHESRVQSALGIAILRPVPSKDEKAILDSLATSPQADGLSTAALVALLALQPEDRSLYQNLADRLSVSTPPDVRRVAARGVCILSDRYTVPETILKDALAVDDSGVRFWLLRHIWKAGGCFESCKPLLEEMRSDPRLRDSAESAISAITAHQERARSPVPSSEAPGRRP